MKLLQQFLHIPGGENEGSAATSNNSNSSSSQDQDKSKETEQGFFGKVKEALRDWSKKDQEDQEFDDTRV